MQMSKVTLFVLIALFSIAQAAQVRFVHAIGNGPDVDVYFDNNLLFQNVPFGRVTNYVPVDPSVYDVTVVQQNNGAVIFSVQLTVDNTGTEHFTTVAQGSLAVNDAFPFGLGVLEDNYDFSSNRCVFRVYHAAAGVAPISVSLNDTVATANLAYSQVEDYQNTVQGLYVVEVYDANNGQGYVNPIFVPFEDETIVNIFFIGVPNSNTDALTMVVSIDYEGPPALSSNSSILAFSMLVLAVVALLL